MRYGLSQMTTEAPEGTEQRRQRDPDDQSFDRRKCLRTSSAEPHSEKNWRGQVKWKQSKMARAGARSKMH